MHCSGATNKNKVEKLADAQKVLEIIDTYGSSSAEAKAAISQYGFSSRIEANWIRIRAGMDDTVKITLLTV